MSKKNNVHPDHYKTAGRTRPGDDILQDRYKHQLTQTPPHLNRDQPVGSFEDELERDTSGEPEDGAQSKK